MKCCCNEQLIDLPTDALLYPPPMNVDSLASSASLTSPTYFGDRVDDDLVDLYLVEPNNNSQDRPGIASKRRPLSTIREESPAFNRFI